MSPLFLGSFMFFPNDCANDWMHRCTWVQMGLYSTECTVYSQANHSHLTVLPQALFHSRQMERNITTACTIAFIKQPTKAVLTVSYFLRERKLSEKAELIEFRHPSWNRDTDTLKSVDVLHVFLSICNICVYFERKLTDEREQVKHLFFSCTPNWSCAVPLERAGVWWTWNGADEQHATTASLLIYTQSHINARCH